MLKYRQTALQSQIDVFQIKNDILFIEYGNIIGDFLLVILQQIPIGRLRLFYTDTV